MCPRFLFLIVAIRSIDRTSQKKLLRLTFGQCSVFLTPSILQTRFQQSCFVERLLKRNIFFFLMKEITNEKLHKYFSVSKKALEKAEKSGNRTSMDKEREDMLDMIKRYISDAEHFREKGDLVNAFAALNYAHGWLDCGARLGIFDVHDSELFTVDDE